jgi:hypothetical protein
MNEEKSEAQGEVREFKIIVNARERQFRGKEISFNQVVELAFGTVSTNSNIVYSVTYKRGHGNKPEGTMDKGDTVKVKEGMIFDVTQTDKS